MGFDEDNLEWTEADFARAKTPDGLTAELLAAFPNTGKRMGRPPGSKQAVSLRLDRDVIDKFKPTGPG
ncbi:MAG TPA: BrnA antitoxin family protein [Allosphingosinicella sp.]|jgi:uncharacterized protein (DUF4415 family)|uniref:BrnA antitoxin family protein n=1 Tax=Allosphingosinicella sp. TaxID=2823234 RepID=UPI002F2A8161